MPFPYTFPTTFTEKIYRISVGNGHLEVATSEFPYTFPITFSNNLQALLSKPMGEGQISPVGYLSTVAIYPRLVGGTLLPVSTIIRAPIWARLVGDGSLGLNTTLTRIGEVDAGGLLPLSGELDLLTGKHLAGILTMSSSLARARLNKVDIGRSITPGGSISRGIGKQLSGSLLSSGLLHRYTRIVLGGVVTPSSILSRNLAIRLLVGAGLLTSNSTLVRTTRKQLQSLITISSSVTRGIALSLISSLTINSSVGRVLGRAVGGALTLAGLTAKNIYQSVGRGTLSSSGNLSRKHFIQVGGGQLAPTALTLASTFVPRIAITIYTSVTIRVDYRSVMSMAGSIRTPMVIRSSLRRK